MKFDPLTGQWEDSAPLQGPFDSRANIISEGSRANNLFDFVSWFEMNNPTWAATDTAHFGVQKVFDPGNNNLGCFLKYGVVNYSESNAAFMYPYFGFIISREIMSGQYDFNKLGGMYPVIMLANEMAIGVYSSAIPVAISGTIKDFEIPAGFGLYAFGSNAYATSSFVGTALYKMR